MAHPSDPLSNAGRFAMGFGTALVLLSVVASTYRAIRRVTVERLIASLIIIGMVWIGGSLSSLAFSSVLVAVTVLALATERSHAWPDPTLPIAPDAA